MYIVDENEKEYRFGDSGPKYLMRGPRMSFGVVRLKPGEDFTSHYHKVMEENFFVVEGTLDFYIDGELHRLDSGKFVHVEPGERHHLVNASEEPARAIFSLAPYADNDKYMD